MIHSPFQDLFVHLYCAYGFCVFFLPSFFFLIFLPFLTIYLSFVLFSSIFLTFSVLGHFLININIMVTNILLLYIVGAAQFGNFFLAPTTELPTLRTCSKFSMTCALVRLIAWAKDHNSRVS